jgi:hypothetical protein
MGVRLGIYRSRLTAALTALALAFALGPACRSIATTDLPAAPSPEVQTAADFSPGTVDSPAPPVPTAAETTDFPVPLTALPGQFTGFHGLVVPDGWFYTAVTDSAGDARIEAVVFTPLDPAYLAAYEDPEFMVPPDFAIGALARSPLPEGADPDALLAGMEASLETFSDADLASLLTGADRIGLINLAALESITVDTAETAMLGGRPAIAVHGTAGFGPNTQPALRILVLLAWTDDSFFTFYGISTGAAWEATEPYLMQIMETVELP